MNRRLADFIRTEMEPILKAWEEFAQTILNAKYMGKAGLRDHAREMLLEIADDLDSYQSESEQVAKSKGCELEDGKNPVLTGCVFTSRPIKQANPLPERLFGNKLNHMG